MTLLLSISVTAKELPIEAFATLPALKQVSVAQNGKKIAFLRSNSRNGDYVIEVRNTWDLSEKPILLGSNRMEITNFIWLNNEKLGVNFRQNIQDGNRNYWASKFAIVNSDGKGDWLVPFNKDRNANISILSLLNSSPEEILISYDINNNYIPDVIKFNINTGRNKTILRGNDQINSGFVIDNEGEVRVGSGYSVQDNSLDTYVREKGSEEWKLAFRNKAESREEVEFLGFSDENPNEVYVKANLGSDKQGAYLYNIKTAKFSERLFGLENVDISGALFSRKKKDNGKLLAFTYVSKHPEAYFVDANEEALFLAIQDLFPSKHVTLPSRSEDDNVIVIHTESGKDPGTYYLLKNKKELEKLGEVHPLLQESDLSNVLYITYEARDGRKIPAYVTKPNTQGPYPIIVMPHGGPWVRDVVIFDEWAQLLANNGFLVIQPNYRGSTGYGIEHWAAGDKNWGLTMQDDLDDAAQFLVKKGLADSNKLMMFGWSYGGYAAFTGSMRDNNIYKCTVAGAGVSNLNDINATLNESRFSRERQRPTIKGINPIDSVDKVNVPIFVVHGDIDQRVPVRHSRDFVDKLKSLNKEHKYLELKGADHFSNTLYFDHKMEFYTELINWLNTKCGK